MQYQIWGMVANSELLITLVNTKKQAKDTFTKFLRESMQKNNARNLMSLYSASEILKDQF